ncbi:NAD(+) diphosphatase [Tissierella pigra]|uniref:NAD(+) diphosphatase n=1 Tax=Tissierella pigra TaxID=2607614 RepID=A0A6N7Y0L7_9FIRM|nr:NAD(+) diphosphatase [Tissierella pigra]MBU5425853.1 NAD(+) diphosphatase [Tissierella pigra]MSU01570.1 NAD(+) diphosphatase [Tissierella pigra]
MGEYIKFEPSKEPLYGEYKKWNMYLFHKDKLLVKIDGDKFIIPNGDDIKRLKLDVYHLQCLGAYEKTDCYSGEIEEIKDDEYKFIDLRTYSKNISHDEFLVGAKALLLLDHVRNNQKCGVCGTKMIMKVSGNDRAMICTNCDNMVWPKTAPAIIVAVTKEDKILLAHNKMFPEGTYSVLAGFVEMGETFEDCVKREVFEEVGIKVHNIKYFGSQPWPFPNSMMIGFTAEYLEGEIKVDNEEIVDAKWFSKEEARKISRKSISISSDLVEWFVNR